MRTLTLQLQTVTQALDHAVEANEHLKSETSTLTTDLASLTRLHEETSVGFRLIRNIITNAILVITVLCDGAICTRFRVGGA